MSSEVKRLPLSHQRPGSGPRIRDAVLFEKTVIMSDIGTSAAWFRLSRTQGAVNTQRFMCKICVPTSCSGFVLQLQERGVSGADRFGQSEAEGQAA
jgi:hypothetical protein